jgi:chondroitin 4-sulfotransferase 11
MADFVGRFENLRNDFARVAEEIGAPGLALPHLLRSKIRQSRHYRDFYDERLKKLVYERYEKDVETFEYSF